MLRAIIFGKTKELNSMVAFLFDLPVGNPGTVLMQSAGANLNSGIFNADLMPTAFGLPVKMVNGFVSAIEEDDTASVFWGLLAAADVQPPAPDVIDNSFGYPAPDPLQNATVMLAGYMIVKCTIGTPVKGGAVYMRVSPALGKNVGDLEADADGSDNVLIPQLTWNVNGKDSNGATVVIARK